MWVSLPVYRVGRVNIGTHMWFVYLRPCTIKPPWKLCDCQRLGSACTPTIFSLYAWALSGLSKEHRLNKEKKKKKKFRQLVLSLQADLSEPVYTDFSCRLCTIQTDSTQYWWVYPNNKLKQLWLIFHNNILGCLLCYISMTRDDAERRMSNPTHHACDFIVADFRHWLCWL